MDICEKYTKKERQRQPKKWTVVFDFYLLISFYFALEFCETMKPQQLFEAFYPRQCTLIDYLSDIKDRLHHPGDSKLYNNLLKQTIVCYHDNQVDLCSFTPSVREGSLMRDVIQRVIQICCHSLSGSAGNIVSIGYHLVRDRNNSTGCASSTSTVVNKYPNSTVDFLSSKCWQILHQRIGDDLMIHLLKDVSLFVMVKNNCYMQVAGYPMYNLDYVQRKEQGDQESIVTTQLTTDTNVVEQAAEGRIPTVSQLDTTLQQELNQDILLHQQIYPQNLTVQQETSMVEVPVQKQMAQETEITQQANEKTVLPMECSAIKEISQNVVVQELNSHGKSSRFNDELKEKKTNKKATKRKRKNPSSFEEPFPKKAKSLNSEKLELKPGKLSNLSSSLCSNICSLYFPQPALMYSTNLRYRFPKRHILSSTLASKSGAVKLIREIFIDSKVVFDDKTKHAKFVLMKSGVRKEGEKEKKKKNQRLPKRFVRMKGLFERIIKRHKRCRFNALLKHHCKGMAELSEEEEKQAQIWEKPVQIQENLDEIQEKLTQIQASRVETQMQTQNHNYNKEKEFESQDEDNRFQENHNVKAADAENERDAGTELQTKQQKYEQAVGNFTPRFQIVRFITAVCNRVIPIELWGTLQNRKAFYNNLKGFINLNKREKYSLGQVVHGIKIKECKWLKCHENEGRGVPLSESEKQKEVFYKWMWWLVRRYIMVILKSFFYITENTGQTRDIFFYRKPVWKIINDFGVAAMKNDLLKPLSKEEAQEILNSNGSLGYSYMRFLPKTQTVRPIINMKHHPLGNNADRRVQASINSRLRNLFEIVKFEKSREPPGSDSTVLGNDGVYQALSEFHSKRKARQDERSLYMVHVDINRCFDSIPLDKMYNIMEDVFEEEEYLVRRFVAIKSVNNAAKKVFSRSVDSGEDCRPFKQFLEDRIQERNLNNAIFVDQVYYACEDRDNILALLRKHLFDNIVKIGSKFYQQIKGIAQGSILSTYLCSYFYSHMEKRYLKELIQDNSSLMMRWVDDFLFLSANRDLADTFLRVMHAGIPEYGCHVTSRKTLVNYETTTSDGLPVRCVSQDEAFPWCGFLIHPKSLETKLDFSKYEDKNKKNSVLRNLHSHPGWNLLDKLRYSLLNKSHPLLMDTEINSRRTVLLNIYEAFFWSASKFYSYCRDFPKGRRIQENPSFCMRVILALPQLFCAQAKLKFKKLKQKAQKQVQRRVFAISENVVTSLCCQAYISCLKKKPSFKIVVRALRKRLRKLPGKICNMQQSMS